MKAFVVSSASLLALLSLGSNVLAEPKVVQVSISKGYPGVAVTRRDGLYGRETILEDLYNNVTGGSYMANVTVGTPPQQVSLVIDTGSSDVFVLAKTADQCTSARLAAKDGPCVGGTFDRTKSKTYNVVSAGGFSIRYQDQTGSAGDYFTDTFSIGGVSIDKFQMGLALNLTTGVGIMGIGYTAGESVAAADLYPGLIDSLVAGGKINRKLYSLYLDSKETTTGSILFGGIDTKKFIGGLKVLNVEPNSRTQEFDSFFVELTSISVTDDSGSTSQVTSSTFSLQVVLDSGTTISYVPPTVLARIITQLSAIDDTANTGIIFVDCDYRTTRPNTYISFGFGSGGPVINVPVSEVIRTLNGKYTGLPFKNACSLGIKSASSAPYLLGDTFLRSAYVVYDLDNNQVGIAQTNFDTDETNVVEAQKSETAIPTLTGVSSGASRVPSAYFTGTKPPVSRASSTSTTNRSSRTSTSALGTSATETGSGANQTTGSGTSSSATSASTTKNGAVGPVPVFDASGLVVLGCSVVFAVVGAIGFMA